MKKRKGSLLQRMMAVLFSAVLATGMVSNAAPMTVLAQESIGGNAAEESGTQDSVSGNEAATVEDGVTQEEYVGGGRGLRLRRSEGSESRGYGGSNGAGGRAWE